MAGIILAVPPALDALNQKGLLERAFHDGLFPNLAYRAEAMPEEWPANSGRQLFFTRPGLLPVTTQALVPGSEPQPQAIPFEQWVATLAQYANTIDTHMPTSVTSNANLFLRNIHQLGLQAGQSINRIARNALFQSYLSGQTVAIAAILATDTSIRVAALNGFTDVVIPNATVAPQPVSSAFPLPIRIGTGAAAISATVTGFQPDDPTDPIGPGTLFLLAPVGVALPVRTTVRSTFAPRVVRSGPGDSVDAIGPGDTTVLQQAINGVAFLRRASVQPHDDGFYHAHISPLANAQVFADPVFQRLNQSLPEHVIYKEGFIGTLSGVMFFMNNESPEPFNSGTLKPTANGGQYASELGAEIVNGQNVTIGRTLITGRGSIYEKYLDESQYVTEAGTTGKIGEFDVTNNGINILTERIRLVLRAPINRLQDVVSATWSITTSFPIPSDITAPSGPERFKRAVILEYAL
jgi:hypothetical protein